jgi:hypothetical protein
MAFEKALTIFAIKYAQRLGLATRDDVELGEEKLLRRPLVSDSQDKFSDQ